MLLAVTGIIGFVAPAIVLGGIGYGIVKLKARHRIAKLKARHQTLRDQSSEPSGQLPELRHTTARETADRAVRAMASARPSSTACPRGPGRDGWAIETHGLTKWFGARVAVDDVELLVPRGSAFGYLGPNGAGKTTLIRVLLGLTRADGGTMSLLGLPVPAERGAPSPGWARSSTRQGSTAT